MKYFNHLTCAGEDSKIQRVRDVYGLAGYGAYFLILEKIAAQIRRESGDPSLTLSMRKWCQHLDRRPAWTNDFLIFADSVGLLSVTFNKDVVTIKVPNLLKYADEYSRKVGIKSGQPPDKSPDIVRFPVSKEVRKNKILGSAPESKASEPAPTEQQILKAREAFGTALRSAGITDPKPENKVPGDNNGKGAIEKYSAEDLSPEDEVRWKKIIEEGLSSDQADEAIRAMLAYNDGAVDVYGFANHLDKAGIKGQDRIKVYNILGVGG